MRLTCTQFILDYVRQYTRPEVQVKREDVLAAWTGIRPLSLDPTSPDTAQLSRYVKGAWLE